MGKKVKLNLDPDSLEEFTNKSSSMTYTMKPVNNQEKACIQMGKHLCKTGDCVLSHSMCPDQNNISQSTMLIMVIVGLTIVIFLIILYCLQQRGRNRTQSLSADSHTDQNSSAEGDNMDNLSLYQPPPPYEEVMSSSIYPNTRVIHQRMNSFTINVPPTPPPNYDAALNILACSQEFFSSKPSQIPSTLPKQPSIRRCQSEEILSPHLLPETSIFNFTHIPQMDENR